MEKDIRGSILAAVASQQGLVARAQIVRLHGRAASARTLRRLEASGDLLPVVDGVWAHAAVRPVSTPIVEAEALWLLTDPEVSLTDRRDAYVRRGVDAPVIGGLPAFQHWGFGFVPLDSVLSVPDGIDAPEASDFVSIRENVRTARADIDWRVGEFPYRRVEPTLVDGLREGIDPDTIASLLREGMWTHHPLDSDLLLAHLTLLAREGGGSAEDGRRDYIHLIALAGGWPEQPGVVGEQHWRRNRSELDELLRREAAEDASDPVGAAARRRDRALQLLEIYGDRRAARYDEATALELTIERTYTTLRASSVPRRRVATVLRSTDAEIESATRVGALHAYDTAGGEVYPDWQFGMSGTLPHLAEVLAAAPDSIQPVSLSGFMTSPQPGLTRDGAAISPRQWLLSGGDSDIIINQLRGMWHRFL